jgi:hypothetical protein
MIVDSLNNNRKLIINIIRIITISHKINLIIILVLIETLIIFKVLSMRLA